MSDRPTISIYSNGRIQRFFYLRDWTTTEVLLQCIDFVYQLWGATEYREIMTRLGGDRGDEYDEQRLLSAAAMTEFDAIVDLTRRVVFYRPYYRTLEQSLETMELVSMPERYDELFKELGWWAAGNLLSFDVLDHIMAKLADRGYCDPAPEEGTDLAFMQRSQSTGQCKITTDREEAERVFGEDYEEVTLHFTHGNYDKIILSSERGEKRDDTPDLDDVFWL